MLADLYGAGHPAPVSKHSLAPSQGARVGKADTAVHTYDFTGYPAQMLTETVMSNLRSGTAPGMPQN